MQYARVKAAWAFKPGYKIHESIIASMVLMRLKPSGMQEMILRSKVDLERKTVLDDMVYEIKSAMSSGMSQGSSGDGGLVLDATTKLWESEVFLIIGEEYEQKKRPYQSEREKDKDGKLLNRVGQRTTNRKMIFYEKMAILHRVQDQETGTLLS